MKQKMKGITEKELKNRIEAYLSAFEEGVDKYWSNVEGVLKADLVLWFCAQGIAESNLDKDVISPDGAIGIMQILPSTFSDGDPRTSDICQCYPEFSWKDLRDPDVSITAGIAYNRWLWNRLRKVMPKLPYIDMLDWVFAEYNWRLGLWEKFGKKEQVIPIMDLTEETRNYINHIHNEHAKLLYMKGV